MGFARKDVERTKMNAKKGQGGLQNRQGGAGQLRDFRAVS